MVVPLKGRGCSSDTVYGVPDSALDRSRTDLYEQTPR